MFWVTPSGFVLLLHILLFDKSYQLTYWLNYSELRGQLRRRYTEPAAAPVEHHASPEGAAVALRAVRISAPRSEVRSSLLAEHAPGSSRDSVVGAFDAEAIIAKWPSLDLSGPLAPLSYFRYKWHGEQLAQADLLRAAHAQAFFEANSQTVVGWVSSAGEPNASEEPKQLGQARLEAESRVALAAHEDSLATGVWADWRTLKLEREVWRSIDWLTTAKRHWFVGRQTYANFFEPAASTGKVSI